MQKNKPIVIDDDKMYDLASELDNIITSMETTAKFQKLAMRGYEISEPSDYACRLLYDSTSVYNYVLQERLNHDLIRAKKFFRNLYKLSNRNSVHDNKGDSAGEVKAYD